MLGVGRSSGAVPGSRGFAHETVMDCQAWKTALEWLKTPELIVASIAVLLAVWG